MRPGFVILFASVGAGCATPGKIPFEEAFGKPPKPVVRPVTTRDPRSNPQLLAALAGFAETVTAAREGTARGAKMPPAPMAAWITVLEDVDTLLGRLSFQTAPFDVARARLVIQTELAVDAALYGDFPPAVAEHAQRAVLQLSARIAELTPKVLRPADLHKFRWPLLPVLVTSPFGSRTHPITHDFNFHKGTDLAAEPSQPIRAAYDGVVVFSGWNGSYGKQVELQHDRHLATSYAHLHKVLVEAGAMVHKGDTIGLAGSTGLSTGVHVHFELLRDGTPEDPEELMPPPPEPTVPFKFAKNETSPGSPQSSSENPLTDAVTASP